MWETEFLILNCSNSTQIPPKTIFKALKQGFLLCIKDARNRIGSILGCLVRFKIFRNLKPIWVCSHCYKHDGFFVMTSNGH